MRRAAAIKYAAGKKYRPEQLLSVLQALPGCIETVVPSLKILPKGTHKLGMVSGEKRLCHRSFLLHKVRPEVRRISPVRN